VGRHNKDSALLNPLIFLPCPSPSTNQSPQHWFYLLLSPSLPEIPKSRLEHEGWEISLNSCRSLYNWLSTARNSLRAETLT